MRFKKSLEKLIAMLLTLSVILAVGPMQAPVYAATQNKTLTLKAAKAMAAEESSAVFKNENAVTTKTAAYKSAVQSVALKEKNLRTFRWSPLLSFKFPQKPDMAESFEFTYKPINAKYEIDRANHTLTDSYLTEYEKVYQSFVSIISLQKKIEFNEERLEKLNDTLAKNRARYNAGEAKKTDVDKLEGMVKNVDSALTKDKSSLAQEKKKLSKIVGIDVTTGYDFENPFVEAQIPRDALDSLKQYTLDNSQTFYDVGINERLAYLKLDTYYSLVKNKYSGSDVSIISSYIEQAFKGEKVNQRAFKSAYDNFINKIEQPWAGQYVIRLLFVKIKFSKEFLKGDLDGARYMEDDPYALMTATGEYQDALLEKNNTEEELNNQVEESFNNCSSLRSAYLALKEQCEESKEELEKDMVRNRIGEMTFEEYISAQDDYEQLQQDMLQAMADYASALYSFDRLTCGGVTKYLEGSSVDMFAVGDGVSYVDEETAKGAYYFIDMLIQRNIFELNVSIPEDFDVDVTDFELYVNGTKIGDKTPIASKLRHVGVDLDNAETARLRFYNGDKYVCECTIDPTVYNGPLDIVKGYDISGDDDTKIGEYSFEQSDASGMATLKMDLTNADRPSGFKLRAPNGRFVGGDAVNDCSKDFKYLGAISGDMSQLDILFYDKDGNYMYQGYFDPQTMSIKKFVDAQE